METEVIIGARREESGDDAVGLEAHGLELGEDAEELAGVARSGASELERHQQVRRRHRERRVAEAGEVLQELEGLVTGVRAHQGLPQGLWKAHLAGLAEEEAVFPDASHIGSSARDGGHHFGGGEVPL